MLNHLGTITLETDRLILRAFKIEDTKDMYTNWATDHEVCKFLSWKPHQNIEETKQVISTWIEAYSKASNYNWVIELKESGEAIGGISVVSLEEKHENCSIGYNLSRSHWNKGITTEALKAVIRYLITEVQFNRIEARFDTHNGASGEVMKKSGMHYEGTLRQIKYRAGTGFYDSGIYAILKGDFV